MNGAGATKRVVSVTPMALRRDKRTFQNAYSLSRLGYASTVVQGEPGDMDGEMPFELITVPGAQAATGVEVEEGPPATAEAAPVPATPQRAPRRSPRTAFNEEWDRFKTWRRLNRMLVDSHRADNDRTYEALPDADVYYVTYFYQYPAVARKCKEIGASYIYDANDAYWKWPGYRWYPAPFRARLRLSELRCVRGASSFVTVSEGVADLLKRRYVRCPRVIRNAHDTRMDEESDVDVRRTAGLDDDTFVLAIVGNEKPSDSVDAAIAALADVPDRVHLVCLGAGYEKHKARAAELGVAERFHTIPPVPPNEVTSALRGADACLINIRNQEVHRHALPTRLFSAIAAGVPVLHPPLPEVRALAEEWSLGPGVDAEDAASIAAGVRELAEDPEAEAHYRANAERAAATLSWEQEERLLAELVEKALDR